MNRLVIDRVGIVSKSPCQLKCNFCAISEPHERDDLTLVQFQSIICELTAHGIKKVELTPLIGDALLHKDFVKMAVFARDNNVQLEVHTNLLNYLRVRKQLMNYDFKNHLSIAVSIYGYSRQQYATVTNKDRFAEFETNVQMLVRDAGEMLKEVTLTARVKIPSRSILHKQLKIISSVSPTLTYETSTFSGNWGGLLTEAKYNAPYKKEGVCGALKYFTGIWPNGDVSYCGCFDIHKDNTVGNIYIDGISKIYGENGPISKIMQEQEQGTYKDLCSKCNYFYR
jgi:radical SAM protein with 4Fe4S-binding SPASM domain